MNAVFNYKVLVEGNKMKNPSIVHLNENTTLYRLRNGHIKVVTFNPKLNLEAVREFVSWEAWQAWTKKVLGY